MQALVSIILPIHNAELFLAKTMNSLLSQSYTNLEIICMNDGSTDSSLQILQSYTDERIKIINQPKNKGLIQNLNEGIQLANGKFIARMDADDIATIDRIEKQVDYLNNNPEDFIVASTVQFINELDENIENWKLDRQTIDSNTIRKKMMQESCIAHPSVMFRSEIKHYQYQATQVHCEDYGLWLALLSDKKIFAKINEPLLFYRVHSQSITKKYLRKTNPFLKIFNCKRKFLLMQWKRNKWSFFETTLFFYMLFDGIKGLGKEIKNLLK